MGDANQIRFVEAHADMLLGPYLEVGSRNYGNTQDLRSLFSDGTNYMGVDLSKGDGVDMVLDLTDDFQNIDKKIGGKRFGTIFCLSVMEHCSQPFVMADNLTRLLQENGKLVLSVPFAWRYHGYPSDYWRFTQEGVLKLFPELTFDPEQGATETPSSGQFGNIDKNIGLISFGTKEHWEKGRYLRGITAKMFKLLGKVGIFRWLSGNGYVLAPTMINLIGIRKN
ncbi:MAG: hypothetical protein C4527_19270 [Candidatus Omnitrophota bacterium]|jgi:hypothetical protein|nr:MAG: hypothetical protein C4527_19270 [Candidatus Omnitrophota bacterium]